MKNSKIKVITALILAFCLLCPNIMFADSSSLPFKDVEIKQWFYDAVAYCYESGIFTGVSSDTFSPDSVMTREMLITAIAKMESIDVNNYTDNFFKDSDPDAWYAPYLQWAYENKVTNGIGNGMFGVARPVTRSEAVTMLYNYLKLDTNDGDLVYNESLLAPFEDKDSVPDFALDAFCWAVSEGIVAGTSDTTLSPNTDFSRAQAVQIFMRYDIYCSKHMIIRLADEEGFDIFSPYDTSYSYRYGSTMIVNEDGSMHSYYSSLGGFSEWDHINYIHMTADGEIMPEETVLQPTPGSYDFYSCCDPGIVYFNGYYYLGYTSTIDREGVCNNVFVARSTSPTGPFEKWNGNGWGGDPMPIMMYSGTNLCWGEGEVAFVELNGTLYIYYTLKGQQGFYTMAATADSTDENWPATIVKRGVAMNQGNAQSGADFKYVDSENKFIGIAIENSFTEDSYIRIYESTDGITYTETQKLWEGVYKYAHNIGISGDPNGHIKEGDTVYISYAYGENWGQWATHMQRIDIATTGIALATDSGKNVYNKYEIIPEGEWRTIAVTTNPHYYNLNVNTTTDIALYKISSRYRRYAVEVASEVSFEIENPEIISIDGFTITALSEGKTNVTATYDGRSVTFLVRVYAESVDINSANPEITEFRAVEETYTVGAYCYYPCQIRAFINCNDLKWGEAYNDTRSNAVFPAANYPITYSGYDTSLMTLDANGLIYAHKPGRTTVTVSMGSHSFDVTVIIR